MRRDQKRRVACLLCSVAFVALAGPASARSLHRHHSAPAAAQTVSQTHDDRYPFLEAASVAAQKAGHRPRQGVTPARQEQVSDTAATSGGFSSNSLVSEARKYIGTNPTGRGSQWCGAFVDLVLKNTGHKGGGNLAGAYAHYGTRVSGPQVGAIAVMGGHVGLVTGVDSNGNPIIISGNTWGRESGGRHTVLEHSFPRGRIIAYVMPNN